MSTDGSSHSRVSRAIETVDRLPLAPSFFGGVVAFVGGYVAFVVTLAIGGNPDFSRPVSTLQQIGGIYYNALNVHLRQYREIAVGDGTIPQEAVINIIQQTDPSLPRLVYYLVPVVVLLIASVFLLDRYVGEEEPLATTGAVVTGLTLGYVLVAMVGTVAVTQRTATDGASETLGPVLIESFAFGIAYPLLISLLVGMAVLVLRHREAVTDVVRVDQA